MKTGWAVVLVLGMSLLMTNLQRPAWALTVQVGGVEIPQGQNDPADTATARSLSGPAGEPVSYGCFTIAGLTSGTKAKVNASDTNNDTLKIENAKITATSATYNYPCASDIVAWHTYTPPPSTNPSGIRFRRTIDAEALRGVNGASNNWMKNTGWINGDEIWGYDQRTFCATPHPTCGNFKYQRYEDWPHATKPLTGDREMRLQVWFKMRYTNDFIKLPSTQVYTDSISGEGDINPELPGHSTGDSDDEEACVKCCKGKPDMTSGTFTTSEIHTKEKKLAEPRKDKIHKDEADKPH
ncbi:MAG: hypothetical protein CAF45_016875 [Nitrospira sp. CG24E]|nr:MAG: hypothetical protein CAF45_016875 [Nitrospira sp. CG24E]